MVHVIIITNPFDAAKGKKEYWAPYDKQKPVREYHAEDGEKLYAVNGVQVNPSATVMDGQEIVVAPKIQKKAFGWILAIGLTIFGAGMAGAAFKAGISGWLMAGRIAGALAMTLIGNHIMTKLTMPKADLTNASEQSNTYGWGTPSTLTGQGYVLPICYGKVKTAGMMLQRHVISDGKNQYLNILYCLAEGELDDVSDIKLNNNPIENYSDVSVEIRNGSNQQSIIPDFNDSYADTALAYELNVGKWNTVTLDGNTANGIEITIAFPNGLYYSNDSGNADYTSVTLKAQYRKVGTSDWQDIPIRNENYEWTPDWAKNTSGFGTLVTWKAHYNKECRKLVGYETYTKWGKTFYRYKNGKRIPIYEYTMTYDEWKKAVKDAHLYDGIIRGKETGVFYRMYRIYDLEPAQYEVRVQCAAKDRTDIRTANKVQWVAVTQVVYDDFTHPGKALLGLKALATDQLSGSDPQLTCTIERSSVYIWNPMTNSYEVQPASNPAWACYDILHGCRKLLNADGQTYTYEAEGIPKENMDYYAFAAWAAMCDSAGIQFHYLFDSAMKVWDAVNYPCRVGRGSVIIVGTKVSCIYDYASPSVQLFTVANIKKDSFSNEYLATESRANSIEVSFMNREKNYERDVLAVFNEEYDSSDAVAQPTQIELMGCTDAKQAYQYGKYKLRENKYEIRTIQFEAFADAIACQIGDVITVQTDVTEWGIGGRIVAVEGNTITVDVDNMDGSDYTSFMYRENSTDQLVRRNIISASGDKVVIDGTNTAEKDCVYAMGKAGYQAKEFKVLSISTNMDEETRTITAVEYYPELYDVDTDKVPDVVERADSVDAPRNLVLTTENIVRDDAKTISVIRCSWISPRIASAVVLEYSTDGMNYKKLASLPVSTTEYMFNAEANTECYVRLYGINDLGRKSAYVETNIHTDGRNNPGHVTNVKAYNRYREIKDGVSRYDIVVSWDRPIYPGYAGAQVWYKTNHAQGTQIIMQEGVSADNLGFCGDWQFGGEGASSVVIPQAVVGDTYRICVVAKDFLGATAERSSAPTVDILVAIKTTIPNTPDGLAITFADVATVTWREVTNADIAYYELRDDMRPGIESQRLLARTNGLKATPALKYRTGKLYLYACSAQGKYSTPAILEYNKPQPKTPDAPTLEAKLGGFAISASAIPVDCIGMKVYIDGSSGAKVLTSQNRTTSYFCGAGIYDVTITYFDMFGEGEKSPESRVTVQVKVDESFLEDNAVTMGKIDKVVQGQITGTAAKADKLEQTTSDLSTKADKLEKKANSLQGEVTGVKEDLNGLTSAVNNNAGSISQLTQRANSIETTVANLDASTTKSISQLTQRANSIETTVANLDASTTKSISQLTQRANSIETTVADLDASTATSIKQNADSISSVVQNLNKSPAETGYSAFTQMQDAINLRVAKDDLISQINATPSGVYIAGKVIKIDGDTVIGQNVISGDSIQSGSISAAKLDVKSLSAITATIGTLRTATSGARMEIKDNLICIYDANNVLRVKMGVW